MTTREIFAAKKQCERALADKKFGECFELCRMMLADARDDYYAVQLDNVEDIYFNIMKFSVQGYNDPERTKIYNDTAQKAVKMVNELADHILTGRSENYTYQTKNQIEYSPDYQHDSPQEYHDELVRYSREAEAKGQDSIENMQGVTYSIQQAGMGAFYYFWLKETYTEQDRRLLHAIATNEDILWQRRGQVISGVMLSLLRAWDPLKTHALLDLYETGINQIKERALFGLVVGLYWYDDLLKFYPGIETRLEAYKNDPELARQIEAIMLQTIKSKETSEITRKWEEEILPEMQRMRPQIEDKLSLDDPMDEDNPEDKNPNWENFFKDSPDLMDKLQEFSKMQLEGSDVLMSAFSRLKHFEFFKELSNWFIPFDKKQYHVVQSLLGESVDLMPFLESLEHSYHMCNSDKYSFCFNIRYIPDAQKQMMTKVFNEEVKSIREMEDAEEEINAIARSKTIYTQYLQDLYRFFKLSPNRSEFRDIFTFKFDLYNKRFYSIIIENENIQRNIGEFYFERNHYGEALEVFLKLEGKDSNKQEVYEKIAYSYQKLKHFERALEYYQKADLFDKNKKWLTKKMAFCYRKLKNYEQALEYYKKAEKIQPDNLYIQTQLGHTYLQLEDYDTALQHYFKVEYKKPDDTKIMRPIAWCSFMLGKMDTALKYNNRIIAQDGATIYDFINMGHLQWAMGNRPEAAANYKKAVKASDFKFKDFREIFEPDIHILEAHDISRMDIELMMDFLYYYYRGKEIL